MIGMTDGLDSAQQEFERWRFRERQLLETIRDLSEEEARLQSELAQVEAQVTYYASLARDMKRELGPPKLSGLLTSFGRGR